MSSSRVTAVRPPAAIEGGRIVLEGSGFSTDGPRPVAVRLGDREARVAYASPTRVAVMVPDGLDGGPTTIRVGDGPATASVNIAVPIATGLHQVDNPVVDRDGNVYVTYSGTRGQEVPVSIFRVRPNGTRETFSSGIVNPTSIALDASGQLYASSRFEGTVYRLQPDGSAEIFATDLGVACGLAFDADGTLLVGDRSGTIFRVDRAGRATAFATLPSSVAAFHLALAPDGALYVTGPTLASYDAVYRIGVDGTITTRYAGFGRPQGLAFDRHGTLHVVEALAGVSGLYRLPADGGPELVLSGPGLVGVAFGPRGELVVCSNDTAYRLTPSG
jgi:sugar lactone lactonase YvrE